jgi:hypothetical protein
MLPYDPAMLFCRVRKESQKGSQIAHFSLVTRTHTKYQPALHGAIATDERHGVSFDYFRDVSALTLRYN